MTVNMIQASKGMRREVHFFASGSNLSAYVSVEIDPLVR